MKNEALIEKLEMFKGGLIAVATDGSFEDDEYKELREEIRVVGADIFLDF